MDNGGISTVKLSGEYSSPCGYCGSSDDTSVSFGMTATRLTVQVQIFGLMMSQISMQLKGGSARLIMFCR